MEQAYNFKPKCDSKTLRTLSLSPSLSLSLSLSLTLALALEKRLGVIENTQASLTKNSAFSARRISAYKADPTRSFIVTYNVTSFNEGNDFSMSTGEYIAPFNGLYYFAVYIRGKFEKTANALLYRYARNSRKHQIYATATARSSTSAGAAAVMRLDQGDHVYVHCRDDLSPIGASFTGHLIRADV